MITTEQMQQIKDMVSDADYEVIKAYIEKPYSELAHALRNTPYFVALAIKISDVFLETT